MCGTIKNRYISFYVASCTIILTRVFLWLTWNTGFMQGQKQDSWHHMYTGIIIFFLSYSFASRWSPLIRAVGVGLFLDEIVHAFHLLHLVPACDYWSYPCILATMVSLMIYLVMVKCTMRI